jgi:hypothetical protein
MTKASRNLPTTKNRDSRLSLLDLAGLGKLPGQLHRRAHSQRLASSKLKTAESGHAIDRGLGFFAYPRTKVQSRITPPKRSVFRSGFLPIPERLRPHPQAPAVYGIRSVRIEMTQPT